MRRRTTTIATGALSFLAIATLAACTAPSAEPAPPPASTGPSATSAPSAPVDPLETATGLLLSPTDLRLTDDAGATLAELAFAAPLDDEDDSDATATADDISALADQLAIAFGSDPAVKDLAETPESAAGIAYTWSGFELRVPNVVPGSYVASAFTAIAHDSGVGDVQIGVASPGSENDLSIVIQVGSDTSALAAAGADMVSSDGVTEIFAIGSGPVAAEADGNQDAAVFAYTEMPGGAVTRLFAPGSLNGA